MPVQSDCSINLPLLNKETVRLTTGIRLAAFTGIAENMRIMASFRKNVRWHTIGGLGENESTLSDGIPLSLSKTAAPSERSLTRPHASQRWKDTVKLIQFIFWPNISEKVMI